MKKLIFSILSFLVLIFLASCGQQKPQESENNKTKPKDVSELTYLEVYMLAFEEGSGGGMDFHGESFGLDAQYELEISDGAPCIIPDCGMVQMLKNKNREQDLEVAIRATFNIPNNPAKEIFRYYVVPADSSISLGCSSICYNGESYDIQRKINSAGYKALEND